MSEPMTEKEILDLIARCELKSVAKASGTKYKVKFEMEVEGEITLRAASEKELDDIIDDMIEYQFDTFLDRIDDFSSFRVKSIEVID